MKQTPAMKTFSRRAFPFLGILKGLQHLINTAWLFAYSLLWNNQVFSVSEKEEAKRCIRDLILTGKDTYTAFLIFCQRVILARQRIDELPADSLALPSVWFDGNNAEGFEVTKEWFHDLKLIRSSLPNHKKELKALAEAVMEFSEEATQKNFHYWRDYFIDRNEPVLLNVFSVFCANHKLNIQ